MKKSTIIGLCSAVAAFVALLVVASFYDLQINVKLGNADSVFGQFFRLFGESTGWFIIPIAAGMLLRAANRKTKAGVVLTVVWAIAMVVGWYLCVNYFLGQFMGTSYSQELYASPYRAKMLYAIIFALMLSGMQTWCVFKVKDEIATKLVFFALVMLIAIAINQAITEIMKHIWTRQRFRNLDIGNGGTSSDGFLPWFKPGLGKNKNPATLVSDSAGMPDSDAYKSFPSGHTSASALTLCVILLPELFEKLKKFKPLFWIVPIVYTVLVAVSRMVNRAHYLSDVLFGATIGTISVFASIAIVRACKKAEEKNKFFLAAATALGAVCDLSAEDAIADETVPAEEEKSAEAPEENVIEEKEGE